MGGKMSLVLPDYRVHKVVFDGRELYFRTYRGVKGYLAKLRSRGWLFLDKDGKRLTRLKILNVYQLENLNVSFRANKDGIDKVCKIHKLKILN